MATAPPSPSEYVSSKVLSKTRRLLPPWAINAPESFASPVPPRELEKRHLETVVSAPYTLMSAPQRKPPPVLPQNVSRVNVADPKIAHTVGPPRLDVKTESRRSIKHSMSAHA